MADSLRVVADFAFGVVPLFLDLPLQILSALLLAVHHDLLFLHLAVQVSQLPLQCVLDCLLVYLHPLDRLTHLGQFSVLLLEQSLKLFNLDLSRLQVAASQRFQRAFVLLLLLQECGLLLQLTYALSELAVFLLGLVQNLTLHVQFPLQILALLLQQAGSDLELRLLYHVGVVLIIVVLVSIAIISISAVGTPSAPLIVCAFPHAPIIIITPLTDFVSTPIVLAAPELSALLLRTLVLLVKILALPRGEILALRRRVAPPGHRSPRGAEAVDRAVEGN